MWKCAMTCASIHFACVARLPWYWPGNSGICDMTHWYVWRDSLVCVTWLVRVLMLRESLDSPGFYQEIQVCMTSVCVKWLMSYVWQDSWLICMCGMTHMDVCHDSCKYSCYVRRSTPLVLTRKFRYVWHDSLVCATWLIGMCAMTRASINVHKSLDFHGMGGLRLLGSLKL